MNRWGIYGVLLLVTSCWAQQDASQSARPERSFSNLIPEGTSWQVTIKKPSDLKPKKPASPAIDPIPQASVAKLSPTTVKKRENAYSSGIRRETVSFQSGATATRYVTKGLVLYEDPITGKPVIDEGGLSSTGPILGVNRNGELDWVTDKYFVGTGSYQGKNCFVYRQCVPDMIGSQDVNLELGEVSVGVPLSELKNRDKAKARATAYIDISSLKPVAYETPYEVWLYDWSVPFKTFTLPPSLKQAMQERSDAVARQKQRYNYPK